MKKNKQTSLLAPLANHPVGNLDTTNTDFHGFTQITRIFIILIFLMSPFGRRVERKDIKGASAPDNFRVNQDLRSCSVWNGLNTR